MKFHNREAWQIENNALRVTVLKGGGHIAEVLDKRTGANPLWIPPWPSIEPADYDPQRDSSYGRNEESRLLCGIIGHNLCLDTFGPPSEEQVRLGISVHGEASIARYGCEVDQTQLHLCSLLKLSRLRVRRTIRLGDDAAIVHIRESVENLSSRSRPTAWTQHVSLGPPFLVAGETQFVINAQRSRVFEKVGFDAGGLLRGADFDWPKAPTTNAGTSDLRTFACDSRRASFTTHLLDRSAPTASFTAYSPQYQLVFGYRWDPNDFPWIGIWEENRSRTGAPWNGEAVACGMEFGVSPFPETNDQMIKRGQLFGVPAFRTLAPGEQVTVEYSAFFLTPSEHSQLTQGFSN